MIKKILFIVVPLLILALGFLWWKGLLFKVETVAPTGNVQLGNTIEIKGFSYVPKTITIKVGDSITWINKDLIGHSATADDNSWDTGILSQGETGTIKFDKAGTYTYHCTPHPIMKGTVIVE